MRPENSTHRIKGTLLAGNALKINLMSKVTAFRNVLHHWPHHHICIHFSRTTAL